MKCRYCKAKIDPKECICPSCGRSLRSQVRVCMSCGMQIGENDKVCANCGAGTENAVYIAVAPEPELKQPAAQPPVAPSPAAKKPAAQPPAAPPPAAKKPAAQPPVAPSPAAKKPAAQPPVAPPPVVEEPVVQPPVTPPPVVEEPVAPIPAVEESVASFTDAPDIADLFEQTIQVQPTIEEPIAEPEPVIAPQPPVKKSKKKLIVTLVCVISAVMLLFFAAIGGLCWWVYSNVMSETVGEPDYEWIEEGVVEVEPEEIVEVMEPEEEEIAPVEEKALITVTVLQEDQSGNVYEIETTKEYLLDALEEVGLVEGKQTASGYEITMVDGVWADADEKESWTCEKANYTGSIELPTCLISDGDQFTFIFHKEKPAVELVDYLGKDVSLVRDALCEAGLTEDAWDTDNRTVYFQDDTVAISYCGVENRVHWIATTGMTKSTIAGLCTGTELTQVSDILADAGFYETAGASQGNMLFGDGEYLIDVFCGAHGVTGVLIRNNGTWGQTMCNICHPEEEMAGDLSEYLLPYSNSKYLTYDDLDHLDREHLCFARNEIYARHGWSFSVPQIAEFFSTKSWYEGTTLPANFNYNVLNEYEQANIKLIVDYEARFGGSYY